MPTLGFTDDKHRSRAANHFFLKRSSPNSFYHRTLHVCLVLAGTSFLVGVSLRAYSVPSRRVSVPSDVGVRLQTVSLTSSRPGCDKEKLKHYFNGSSLCAADLWNIDGRVTKRLKRQLTGETTHGEFSLSRWHSQWILNFVHEVPPLVKHIWMHQHPNAEECYSRKLLIVRPVDFGLGSQIHMFAAMLLYALDSDRILVIDTEGFNFRDIEDPNRSSGWHLGSWVDYFVPISACSIRSANDYEPLNLQENQSNIRAVYWDPFAGNNDLHNHWRDWLKYFSGWAVRSNARWATYQHDPSLAFAEVTAALMVFREDLAAWVQRNPVVNRVACVNRVDPSRTLSMHIRNGDLLYNDCENSGTGKSDTKAKRLMKNPETSMCHPKNFSFYFGKAAQNFDIKNMDSLFLFSDDSSMLSEAQQTSLPLDLLMFGDELMLEVGSDQADTSFFRSEEYHVVLERWQLLRALHAVSRTKNFLGKMASNIGRLAHELISVAHKDEFKAVSVHGGYSTFYPNPD